MSADFEFTVTATLVVGIVDHPGGQPQDLALQCVQNRQPVESVVRRRWFVVGIEWDVIHPLIDVKCSGGFLMILR